MQLLTWLTIIYLIVLVLALAVSLIAIFLYLWKIGSALAAVERALVKTKANTQPLEGHVEAINGGLVGVRDGLRLVDGHLASTDDSLEFVAERLGIRETV